MACALEALLQSWPTHQLSLMSKMLHRLHLIDVPQLDIMALCACMSISIYCTIVRDTQGVKIMDILYSISENALIGDTFDAV